MRTVLNASLYENNPKRFQQICDLSRKFMGVYCVNSSIGENIFQVLSNYARRNDVTLEILRYPFQDDALWAFTFLKKGTIFVCINSELPQNKQVFAAAHELYHIHCYIEAVDQNTIRSGSLLDSKTVDEAANTQENIEANAFAALLLMPDYLLNEQMMLYSFPKSNVAVDDILALMDFFGTPYKAAVLRLYESNHISKATATELLSVPAEDTVLPVATGTHNFLRKPVMPLAPITLPTIMELCKKWTIPVSQKSSFSSNWILLIIMSVARTVWARSRPMCFCKCWSF